MARKKNIFENASILKSWALDLAENCGSIITQAVPDMDNVNKLIEEFVSDYNEQMENNDATQ